MDAKFTFSEIEGITFELKEASDSILSFSYTDNCIFLGTSKGAIHIIDTEHDEAMMFGPYHSPIKDIFSLGDTFAYVSSSKVALMNKKTHTEIFSVSSSSYEKVLIWSNSLGNSALVCATSTNLNIIQKGWVNTNIKQLRYTFRGMQSVKINAYIICIISSDKGEILNLLTEEVLFSARLEDNCGFFHWISAETLLFTSGCCIDILKYKSERRDVIIQSERINIPVVPNSLASIRQHYIIFNTDKVYMLGINREILICQGLPAYGKLVSSNKNDSRFLLVTPIQVFICDLPNIKERILALIRELKLDEAKSLVEKYNITALADLRPFIDHLIRIKKFEEAAGFIINSGINPQDAYSRELISTFAENYKVHLIITHVPYIENQFLNSQIINALTIHKELLIGYLKKFPQTAILTNDMLNKLKALGFNEVILEIFLHHNKIIDALEMCLTSKSEKSFVLLEKFPEKIGDFTKIPNFYQKIFGIDVEKALKICESLNISPSSILNWLPPELIIKYLTQLPTLDLKLERSLLEEILGHSPETLKEHIEKFKFLSIEDILQSLTHSKFDELKVFLLEKLENRSEILKILRNNFMVRIKYLKHYPELWPETLAEAKSSNDSIRKVLTCIHYYENAVEFIQTLDFHEFDKEIRAFITNFGGLVKIQKLSVSSTRLEEFQIFKKLYKERIKGIHFKVGTKCSKCLKPIQEFTCLRLRKCGHHTHKDCLEHCQLCIDPSILH